MDFITTNPAALANLIREAAYEAVRVEWEMDFSAAGLWSYALKLLSRWAADEMVAIPRDAEGNFSQSILDSLSAEIDRCQQRVWAA